MDLTYTPEQDAFRTQVRAWLAANAPASGLPSVGTREGFEAHRAWEQAISRAGFSRQDDVVLRAIFEDEYMRAGAPERITVVGQKLLAPTLSVHGSDEQRERWLPGIWSADTIWSQGFSEHGAGSDLAGIRTRAVLSGGDWIVNGQKIWTSYGAFADHIFALVRTDPGADRHRGLTFLALEMSTPGVEARPIVQLDGHAGFAEVFFTDVRVPSGNVIGEPGEGWTVAMTMLGFERDAPAASPGQYERDVMELVAFARERGLDTDDAVRDRIAALWVGLEGYRAHALRTLSRLAAGDTLGHEASATKLLWSELEHAIFDAGQELAGEVLPEGDWHTRYWFARAAPIYAGTNEIQRNVIAERVLGLPR